MRIELRRKVNRDLHIRRSGQRCRTRRTYGCSDESTLTQTVQVTVQIPAPTPTTPAHFTAYPSAQAGNPIRFFWGAVAGADRYELQESLITCRRTNDPVNFQFAANAAPPFTRRAALAKCAGQEQDPSTYQYVIRACNGSNCSAWSTDVVTTEVGSVPTGPESTTTTTFIHTDGLRSPVVETTASGAVKTRVRYEPYGATRLPATQGPGYAGHVTDEKTGLSYMQQRYYDPIAGRFLSIDPVSADAGSFNRYWYASNNPYRFIDPDGRASWDCTGTHICGSSARSQLATNARTANVPRAVTWGATGAAIGAGVGAVGSGVLTGYTAGANTPLIPPEIGAATAAGGAVGSLLGAIIDYMGGSNNPYSGPVETPVVVVDSGGNAIPVAQGERINSSPDGKYQQVVGADGKPTGVRVDKGGHRTHADPKAKAPHGHVPGVTDDEGNPHLPLNEPQPSR